MSARGLSGLCAAVGAGCRSTRFRRLGRCPFPDAVGEDSVAEFKHTFSITNSGPDNASGVLVMTAGPLPAKGAGISGFAGTSLVAGPFSTRVEFTGMPPGNSITTFLAYSSSHPTVERTTATLTPSTPDPDPSNSSSSETTAVTGLSISDGGFADQLLGTSATKTLTVTNGSGAGQFMGGEQLGGADTTDFAIADPGTCLSHFVANGDSCTFTTSFKPTATGARSGFVAVAPIDGPIDAAIGTLSGRGTTAPVASPPTVLPDTSAPAITLSRVPRTIKLRTLKKRGVVFTVAGNEPIGVDAQMLATARRATLRRGRTTVARAFNLVLAESKQPVAGGARAIRLRPSRRLLGKAKRFKLQVAVSAADAAGNTSTKTRIVKVR